MCRQTRKQTCRPTNIQTDRHVKATDTLLCLYVCLWLCLCLSRLCLCRRLCLSPLSMPVLTPTLMAATHVAWGPCAGIMRFSERFVSYVHVSAINTPKCSRIVSCKTVTAY